VGLVAVVSFSVVNMIFLASLLGDNKGRGDF